MNKKTKRILLIILLLAFCILCGLSFVFMSKTTTAQSINIEEKKFFDSNDKYVCHDIIPGINGDCYPNENISTLDVGDYNFTCLEYCSSHGSGREKGGLNLLSAESGCRNYAVYNYPFWQKDKYYWINTESMADAPTADLSKFITDINTQLTMWNNVEMCDGTGQIVYFHEVNTPTKPDIIDGEPVIEITAYDFGKYPSAGEYDRENNTVKLNYNFNEKKFLYSVDTIAHEFGHVMNLVDIDHIALGGLHKTIMGYNRGTTEETLSKAIKYQDIQGVAVSSGRHTCQNSYFMRYVKVGNEYRHICFYCDRIDNRTTIIPGSSKIESNYNCNHDYKKMVKQGSRTWKKCTKCYNVIEDGSKIILHADGNISTNLYTQAEYGKNLSQINEYAPKKTGYTFDGYYDNRGKKYYEMRVEVDEQSPDLHNFSYYPCVEKIVPVSGVVWDYTTDVTLYARWKILECDYTYQNINVKGGVLSTTTVHLIHGQNTITPISINNFKFKYFEYYGKQYTSNPAVIDIELYCDYRGIIDEELRGDKNYSDGIFLKNITCQVRIKDEIITAYYEDDGCLAAGSMITLADGSQVAVENLKGDEWLLVWNLYTGTYDTAPILFIDSEPLSVYKVINLTFSDGSTVKVISEHGFWDYDLNKYVYLDENAKKYIGHWFNKGEMKVQLTAVEIKEEYTSAWSPVTYGHLCYFVDGMLSMPGGIAGLFNIFDVDAETMKYDEVSMQLDIETYGLFTYEEFTQYLDISEKVFNAFNAQYFKVAIGKGLITMDELSSLYERYSDLLA